MKCLPLLFALPLIAPLAMGDVLMTEIMYNPDSPEGRFPGRDNPDDKGEPVRTEWVEIHNAGDEPVDISGWHLFDEDGQTTGLPEDTILQPGQIVVLIPGDCEVAEFKEAWGDGFAVYPLQKWGRGGLDHLSNSPSDTSEILELRNASNQTIDQVNYDDEGDWPSDRPDGPSIYLLPNAIDPASNDAPTNWARSEVGVHGARQNKTTKHFTGNDIGSPGYIPQQVTDPKPKPLPDE